MKLLILLAAFLLPVTAAAAPDGPKESLSGVKGADMPLYDLYVSCWNTDRRKAAEYAEMFMERADSLAADPAMGLMAQRIAFVYEEDRKLWSKAVEWQDRALYIYSALGDRERTAVTEYNLARLYYRLGRYHLTFRHTEEALDYFEQRGRLDKYQLECYNLNGAVYNKVGDLDKARQCFTTLAEGAREIADSTRLLVALNNLAVIAEETMDTAMSRKLLSEAAAIAIATRDTVQLANMYLNMGAVYLASGTRLQEADRYLSMAAPLLRSPEAEGLYHIFRSDLMSLRHERGAAIDEANEALRCYSRGEMPGERMECLSKLYRLYLAAGDTLSAYRALAAKARLEDSISQDNVYEELLQYQGEIIRRQENEKRLERRNLHTFYWSLSFIILSISVLTAFLYSRKKDERLRISEAELRENKLRNEKNEQEIQSINELLELKKMEQYQLGKTGKELSDRLSEIRNSTRDPETRKLLGNLLCQDQLLCQDDKQWKELNRFIPEFNSTFYRNLISSFPDLTINERRLCVLLNMNLTTKEISEITRQSLNGINAARTRLRVKLGLRGDSVSLQEFLSRFN